MKQLFLSFDIGITHLAFNLIELEMDDLLVDPLPIRVLQTETVDIANIPHKRVTQKACTLYHSGQVSDRMAHFFQEYEPQWSEFGEIAQVFLERQPPLGVTSVEALLFQRYRHKVHQIAPQSMHKWMKISHLDSKGRKTATIAAATPYLQHFYTFSKLARKHDQSDALMLFLYAMHKRAQQKQSRILQRERNQRMNEHFQYFSGTGMNEFFEGFRFKKKKRTRSDFLAGD